MSFLDLSFLTESRKESLLDFNAWLSDCSSLATFSRASTLLVGAKEECFHAGHDTGMTLETHAMNVLHHPMSLHATPDNQ
jgi:hypothetical protein